jgi:hydrogenase maturation protein HypF
MIQRIRITARGAVQGVGFRPFVYRLASGMKLAGRIVNTPQGVLIEAEGDKSRLNAFLLRLQREGPPRSRIQGLEFSFLDPAGLAGFQILESDSSGEPTAAVLPDLAVCADCVGEILDPTARRYLYPFTNCTNCGPRFTIIESLPYDRPNTVMKAFEMCDDCRSEYEDPNDRRFHAQPIACPECGPMPEWIGSNGFSSSRGNEALLSAALAVESGRTVAVKGLGGFHLIADAWNDGAVRRLRERKGREEKPFALMYPSIEAVREDCETDESEERLLLSPEAPVVLLHRKTNSSVSAVAASVAPGNPNLGVMLPYTPLHCLLLKCIGRPVVATSGNRSDEPICTGNAEAARRLGGIAEGFLVHDRPIARRADDSVVRVALGREMVIRRARGYAPLPVRLKNDSPSRLAVGGHLKNTVALSVGRDVVVGPHIGDLDTAESHEAFQEGISALTTLYHADPPEVVCDMHPDYWSTRYVESTGKIRRQVQHHVAHVAACMADNGLDGPLLGVAWDGTGFGTDGTVWGGEFILADGGSFTRIASLRRFRLPGNEAAVREPRRAALGVLFETLGESLFQREELPPVHAFSPGDRDLLGRMIRSGWNSPETSSAGRLFDAVASIAGIRQENRFEGQAAMELEFAREGFRTEDGYPFIGCPKAGPSGGSGTPWRLDWRPMVRAIVRDATAGVPVGIISAKFHNTLAELILDVAVRARMERVVLTGGCFQNMVLLERTVGVLERAGFRPYWHRRIPTNDGGIALGQAAAAAAFFRNPSRSGLPAGSGRSVSV